MDDDRSIGTATNSARADGSVWVALGGGPPTGYTEHDAHGYRNGFGPCVCADCDRRRRAYYATARKPEPIPWWGWALIGVLVLAIVFACVWFSPDLASA